MPNKTLQKNSEDQSKQPWKQKHVCQWNNSCMEPSVCVFLFVSMLVGNMNLTIFTYLHAIVPYIVCMYNILIDSFSSFHAYSKRNFPWKLLKNLGTHKPFSVPLMPIFVEHLDCNRQWLQTNPDILIYVTLVNGPKSSLTKNIIGTEALCDSL